MHNAECLIIKLSTAELALLPHIRNPPLLTKGISVFVTFFITPFLLVAV